MLKPLRPSGAPHPHPGPRPGPAAALRRRPASLGAAALGAAARSVSALSLAALGAFTTAAALAADPEAGDPAPPPDLVELRRRATAEGPEVVGVFNVRTDPAQPDLRRVQLWQARGSELVVSTDVVRCSPTAPGRLTGLGGAAGRRMVLRSLNPGGVITSANRLDHLVWWAACVPELAGRDPATLVEEAHRRGFHGGLQEREEILPAAVTVR